MSRAGPLIRIQAATVNAIRQAYMVSQDTSISTLESWLARLVQLLCNHKVVFCCF